MSGKKNKILHDTDGKRVGKKYIGKENTILSENISLSLNCKKTEMNNNILVVDMNGDEIESHIVLPNLLEANSNYVIVDVEGEYYTKTRSFFRSKGYDIKVLDLTLKNHDFICKEDLVSYNPFAYAKNENDVQKISECFFRTQQTSEPGIDDITEKTFLDICILYLYYEKGQTMTFLDIFELLRKLSSNDTAKQLSEMLSVVEKKCKNLQKVESLKLFVERNQMMFQSTILNLSMKLDIFNHEKIESVTTQNTLHFQDLAKRKQILFILTSDMNHNMDFLVSVLHEQLYQSIHAMKTKEKKRHIRCILERMEYTMNIPELANILTTCEMDHMSYIIVVESLQQLKIKCKNYDKILCNCDSIVCFKCRDKLTVSYICNIFNGNITKNEITNMSKEDCVVFLMECEPVVDKKYKLETHRNYKYVEKE